MPEAAASGVAAYQGTESSGMAKTDMCIYIYICILPFIFYTWLKPKWVAIINIVGIHVGFSCVLCGHCSENQEASWGTGALFLMTSAGKFLCKIISGCIEVSKKVALTSHPIY